MDVQLEPQLRCTESNVKSLMKNIKTPLSLEDLEKQEYINSRELDIIDRSLKIYASRWGTNYGYKQEQDGAPVQNLFPIYANEVDQISSSSKAELEIHTETAFHPFRPDVVCLLCVREDPNAGTVYATLGDIIKEMNNDEAVMYLHLPMYYTRIDKSFLSDRQQDRQIQTSILFDGGTRMTYDRALMTATNKMAQEALDLFSAAIDRCKKTVYLKTGELLRINNHRVVHGRTAFSPKYDGTDRWLKRAMVLSRGVIPESDIKISSIGSYIVTTDL